MCLSFFIGTANAQNNGEIIGKPITGKPGVTETVSQSNRY